MAVVALPLGSHNFRCSNQSCGLPQVMLIAASDTPMVPALVLIWSIVVVVAVCVASVGGQDSLLLVLVVFVYHHWST